MCFLLHTIALIPFIHLFDLFICTGVIHKLLVFDLPEVGQFSLALNTTVHCHCLHCSLLISSSETLVRHRLSPPPLLSKSHTLAHFGSSEISLITNCKSRLTEWKLILELDSKSTKSHLYSASFCFVFVFCGHHSDRLP